MHACVQALVHVNSTINDRKCFGEDNNRTSVRFKMSCVDWYVTSTEEAGEKAFES